MPPHARPGVSAARAANAGGINGDRKEEVSYHKSSRARKKIENPWTSFLHAANDNAAIKVWRGVCVYRDMYLCARFLRMQKRIFSTALCTSLSRPARPPAARFPSRSNRACSATYCSRHLTFFAVQNEASGWTKVGAMLRIQR